MYTTKGKVIHVVSSLAQLADLMPKVAQAKVLVVDAETDGLGRFAMPVGIGLAWSEEEALYIPLSIFDGNELITPWGTTALATLRSWLIEAFTQSRRLIGHNIVFDAKVIENYFKVNIIDYVLADTMLLHHTVINENPPHGLKDLAALFLTPDANTPQDDLKASVIANGGRWNASDKDMFKGDYKLLGTYCGWDVLYTMALYNLWIGEVDKQGLQELWNKEVIPLLNVTYSLNTVGLKLDIPYFQQLKKDMAANITNIEAIIFEEIADSVYEYEYKQVLTKTKITKRSELGRLLLDKGWDESESTLYKYKLDIIKWYKTKKGLTRIFNLDSNTDKGYLLYDVLGFDCVNTTESGKRAVTKADLERLEAEHKDNEVIKLLAKRGKEIKILSTYVEPLLDMHVDGRIYPSFNATGTVSGRYSSSDPNFQNLPRDDKRIKKGIIADDNYIFINADMASLEAKCFAFMSGDKGLKEVYWKDLDLYSKIAIDVLGIEGASANEKDSNFLKIVDPDARQLSKVFTLSVPYGASAFRLTSQLKMEQEEAQELLDKYLDTYPELRNYMRKSEFMGMKNGYVTNLIGRKKRFTIINVLYNKYGIKDITPRAINQLWSKVSSIRSSFESSKHLYRMARNELNLAKNFRIQSLAASIVNAAAIKLHTELVNKKIKAKICLQIHDSVGLLVHKDHVEEASKTLQDAMEYNWVADKLDVRMKAVPVVCNTLEEDK